jgi:uncharacterized coiled-coil DUF342 family protein
MNRICTNRGSAASGGVNLLIVLALSLCALAGWQWKRETGLFEENVKLKADRQQDHETKHQQLKSIENLQAEITRLEGERKTNSSAARANEMKVVELSRKASILESEVRSQSNLVAYFKVAFERATNQLSIANSNTFRANEVIISMRKAVEDRNDVATRLNDMNKKFSELMNERNEIVGKFNAFMQEVDAERTKDKAKDKDKK